VGSPASRGPIEPPPSKAGRHVKGRQRRKERKRKESSAQKDECGHGAHAARPKGAHAGEKEADPLVAQLSRADEWQHCSRDGEGQSGEGEDQRDFGSKARTLGEHRVAAHTKGLLTRFKASRAVFLATEATC